MKLPDLPIEQVAPARGFGEVDYALQHQGYAGQVLGKAIENTGQSLENLALAVRVGQQQVQTLKARKDFHAAGTNVLTALNTQQTISEGQLGEVYGGVDKIPQEILSAIPGGTKAKFTKPDGTVVEQGRNDIPMYAIRAQLYKRIMEPNVENLAKTIDEPGWSRSFALGARLDVEQQAADIARQSAREAVQHVNTITLEQFDEALRVGDWATAETALQMGGKWLSPVVREHMEHTMRITQAKWGPNEILAGEDIPRLQGLKEGLQNISTNGGKFKVKDSLGQEEDLDTSALTETLRRSYVRMADAKIRQLTHLRNAGESIEDKQNLNAAYGLLNRLYEQKDVAGLRSFASDMARAGLNQKIQDQHKLLTVYETAAALAAKLDPKAPKPKRDDFAVASLISAVNEFSRGKEDATYNGQPVKDIDIPSALLAAHAYSPALHKQLLDAVDGKAPTSALIDSAVKDITRSVVRMSEDEIAALPKNQRKDEAEAEWGKTSLAVRQDLLEYIKSEGGTVTPEKLNRWRAGYVTRNPDATFDMPKDRIAGIAHGGGPTAIPPNLEIPGRIRLQMVMNRAALGLPMDPEKERLWYAEFYRPYEKELVNQYKKKNNGVGPPDDFLLKSAAYISKNMMRFKSENKTPDEIVKATVNAWNPKNR